jgi:hypothetical protein
LSALRFAARVSPKGELVFADATAWRFVLARWKGRTVTVTLEPFRKIRSNDQNRRYWGRIVRGVGGWLNARRDIPLSKEQVHAVLASAFLGMEDTPIGQCPAHTKTLTTQQFTDYMDRIEGHFTPLGVAWPDHRDYDHEEDD